MYPETKQKVTVGITPTGKNGLDAIAKRLGLSRSELVEQIGRGILLVQSASNESHKNEINSKIYDHLRTEVLSLRGKLAAVYQETIALSEERDRLIRELAALKRS